MGLWLLHKEFRFEAAHMLPLHDGKCKRLHGHSWKGTIIVSGTKLQNEGPKSGMVLDYGDIKAALDPIVEQMLDHHYLNMTLPLDNPTSEEIARWLFYLLKTKLPMYGVIIEETCTARCVFMESPACPLS